MASVTVTMKMNKLMSAVAKSNLREIAGCPNQIIKILIGTLKKKIGTKNRKMRLSIDWWKREILLAR